MLRYGRTVFMMRTVRDDAMIQRWTLPTLKWPSRLESVQITFLYLYHIMHNQINLSILGTIRLVHKNLYTKRSQTTNNFKRKMLDKTDIEEASFYID